MIVQAGYSILIKLPLPNITMITVEKSDPFSSQPHRLSEMLSAEPAAITGNNGKANFTAETINDDKALWVLAKNAQGDKRCYPCTFHSLLTSRWPWKEINIDTVAG